MILAPSVPFSMCLLYFTWLLLLLSSTTWQHLRLTGAVKRHSLPAHYPSSRRFSFLSPSRPILLLPFLTPKI